MLTPYHTAPGLQLFLGDCLAILPELPAQSVDAIVTDPPAGIAFMGAKWDNPWEYGIGEMVDNERSKAGARARVSVTSSRNAVCRQCHGRRRGGAATRVCQCLEPDFDDADRHLRARDTFIAQMTAVFTEARRVLKPGGHALVWALPRTAHWTATALEDAGFEIRDRIAHYHDGTPAWVAFLDSLSPEQRELYERGAPDDSIYGHINGQGFPKSTQVSKVLRDKGLSCDCPIDVVECPEITIEGYHATRKTAATVPTTAMHRMRRDVDSNKPNAISPQQDMFAPMCGGADWESQQRPQSPAATSNMQVLSDGIPHDEWAPRGNLLQQVVPSQGVCSASTPVLSQHERAQAEGPALRSGQSSLEGRSNILQEEGQLYGRGVHARASVGAANGTQGRVHHAAPPGHGPDVRAAPDANGSSQPLRSQPEQQRAEQLGALADECGPQAGRGWPICERCSKPMVPDGLGTSLKPAVEFWILARAPLSESTVASNVARWGTGALNIGATRIGTADGHGGSSGAKGGYSEGWAPKSICGFVTANKGRWPANVMLSHTLFCQPAGTRRVRGAQGIRGKGGNVYGGGRGYTTDMDTLGQAVGYADPDGYETVEAWTCADFCPIRLLDAQSGGLHRCRPYKRSTAAYSGHYSGPVERPDEGQGYGDTGGASRFFATFPPDAPTRFAYIPKPSTAERNRGLEGMPLQESRRYGNRAQGPLPQQTPQGAIMARNIHPTVKSIALMSWLIRLITPPGGTVLDPFAGSGSTGIAALAGGWEFIGIEQDEGYCEIARQRLSVPA